MMFSQISTGSLGDLDNATSAFVIIEKDDTCTKSGCQKEKQ